MSRWARAACSAPDRADTGAHLRPAALGRRNAIALQNDSLALELALIALGIGSGDEVVKTSRTFVASVCAQVHVAAIDGRLIGSFGDVAAFSSCQDSIVRTGGEGGLLTLDDEKA